MSVQPAGRPFSRVVLARAFEGGLLMLAVFVAYASARAPGWLGILTFVVAYLGLTLVVAVGASEFLMWVRNRHTAARRMQAAETRAGEHEKDES